MDKEEIIKVLDKIDDGDYCFVFSENYCGSNIVVKLRDNKGIIFNGHIIPIEEIKKLDIKNKNPIDYEKRKLRQEDVRKTCNEMVEFVYMNRLEFLLELYEYRDINLLMFEGLDIYEIIQSIIKSITAGKLCLKKNINNYQVILKSYLGDNIATDKIIEIIEKCLNKCKEIKSKPLSWFYEDNKERFIEYALEKLFATIDNSIIGEEEKKLVKLELLQVDNIESIVKLIFTYKFASTSLSGYDELDFMDYTYISVSVFKLTEILFNKMLNKYWSHKKIIDRRSSHIDLAETKLVLGKMKQFLSSDDDEIVRHLGCKKKYLNKLNEKLGVWIEQKRNGYLHKDILNLNDLRDSILVSIEIMCLIVLVVKV